MDQLTKNEGRWTMKVAIYARVSTTAGQSVEMQLRDLRQLAQQRGFEIVAEFCDEGVSGSCDSRPQLDRMLADAQRGKFQPVSGEVSSILSGCSRASGRGMWP
jgi:DNA invertase Pin-like site-specific DNA recombinase